MGGAILRENAGLLTLQGGVGEDLERCQGCVLSQAGGWRCEQCVGSFCPSLQHLGPNVISFHPCFAKEETEPQRGGVTSSQAVGEWHGIPSRGHTLAFPETPLPHSPLLQPAKEPTSQGQICPARWTPEPRFSRSGKVKSLELLSAGSEASPALSRALLFALGLWLERRIPVHQKTGNREKAPTFRPIGF